MAVTPILRPVDEGGDGLPGQPWEPPPPPPPDGGSPPGDGGHRKE